MTEEYFGPMREGSPPPLSALFELKRRSTGNAIALTANEFAALLVGLYTTIDRLGREQNGEGLKAEYQALLEKLKEI